MKNVIIGLVMILSGMALGIYLGFVVMFLGGIFDLIYFIQGNSQNMSLLGWGITKIWFSGLVGVLSSYILIVPGVILVKNN